MRISKFGRCLLLSVPCLVGASTALAAQVCPPGVVCVSGVGNGGGGGYNPIGGGVIRDDSWMGGSGGDTGGGGGGGSGSAPSTPPPKTPEQKAAERAVCDNARNEAKSELQTSYSSQMAVCASNSSHFFGYFKEQVAQFLFEAAGAGSGSCSTNLSRQFSMMNTVYDNRRDVCVAAANKG